MQIDLTAATSTYLQCHDHAGIAKLSVYSARELDVHHLHRLSTQGEPELSSVEVQRHLPRGLELHED